MLIGRMVKLSSFFMERARSQQLRAISRKQKRNRKQKSKGIDGNLGINTQISSDNGGIDELPDDVLINILSHLNLKEAARASVLARRWKYLWRFMFGTLQFDSTGVMELEEFESWVNTVLDLHQGRYIEGMVISMEGIQEEEYKYRPWMPRAIDSWVYFAMQKEVGRFELILPLGEEYEFPSIEMLVSHSHGVSSSPFRRLRTLRLANLDIKDEVVHYFLASCPNLEELCISYSCVTKNLQVVDPPSLRVLEINRCRNMKSAEISAVNLVSLAYGGGGSGLQLKNLHNLRELTIRDELHYTFVTKPKEQTWYFDQLVKLVVDFHHVLREKPVRAVPEWPQFCSLKRLEVRVILMFGQSLLFFTSLINASPQLCEFRIEMEYASSGLFCTGHIWMPFPKISGAEAVKFDHKSLKVVEMSGFIGRSSEEKLLLELFENAPLIERVVIDTESHCYEYSPARLNSTDTLLEMWARRNQSKERAKHLVSKFSQKKIDLIVT